MVNLPESQGYVANIQGLSTNDPLEGGVDGALAIPLKQLASRTKWLKDQIAALAWQVGDIKEIACDAAYIASNFTGTGLGTGVRVGWAICNGQNGTIDKGGRVGVGHGNGYTVGATGGSKDAVVVAHSHQLLSTIMTNPGSSANVLDYGNDWEVSTLGGSNNTTSTGESGINKNMQPYIVTLFIQKIA